MDIRPWGLSPDTDAEEAPAMWNYENSLDRVVSIAAGMPEIAVSDLSRDADLENITFPQPKRVRGSQLYVDIANAGSLIEDLLDADDRDAARRPTWRLQLLLREVARIARDFGARRIHFQGTRLHAVVFRPGGDPEEIAARAVLTAFAIARAIEGAYNPLFEDETPLETCAGTAYGEALATRAGSRGDTELLFLGNPANVAAKIIEPRARLRACADTVSLASSKLELTSVPGDDGASRIAPLSAVTIEEAAAELGITWSVDGCKRRIEDDLETIPEEKVGISCPTGEINKDTLGLSDTKLTDGVTVFGDIDGFTALVEEAHDDDQRLGALLRTFHVTRAELRHVAVQDYDPTLRIQYQGDRIQVHRHMPTADPEERAVAAISAAAGWHSSISKTLPQVVDIAGLSLAVGADAGATIVTKLGLRGARDVLCVGRPVRRAEAIQRALDGRETGLSKDLKDALPEASADLFEWDMARGAHICSDLDVNKLAHCEQAAAWDSGATERVGIDARGKIAVGAAAIGALAIAPTARAKEHDVRPQRRWSP